MNRYLLVPVLLLGACGVDPTEPTDDATEDPADPEDPEAPTTPAYGPPRQGMETQGRYLLGSALDPLSGGTNLHLNVLTSGRTLAGAARTVEFFGSGGLRIAGTNVNADDLILTGASGGELQIDLSRSYTGITIYRIKYRETAGHAWSDPCAGAEAAPFFGSFTTAGLHEDTAGRLSFACADGVAYKCFDWGYRPGSVRTAEAWQIHQACTRMARADYCASGNSHTLEGTTISIFDEVGINPQPPAVFYGLTTWPPPRGDFYFEAGWRGESQPPVCLSKLRWAQLPPGGYCPTVLPDPRIDVTAQFCDDMAASAEGLALVADTKLFNGSRYSVLPMHVWKDGDDRVSTIDGYYADENNPALLEPYRGVANFNWQQMDGILLRSLPTSIPGNTVDDVHLYADGNLDLVYLPVSAAALLPPSYRSQGWRGMALEAPGTDFATAPLVLYQSSTTGDMLTTTLTPPAGYTSLGTVGHLGVADQPE